MRLVLGHKSEWVAHMMPRLPANFEVAETMLADHHAEWSDIAVPLTLSDYAILRANPAFIGKALYPPAEAVEICHDKLSFRQWFRERFDSCYLPERTSTSPMVIVRPRRGEWGQGARLLSNFDDVELARCRADMSMLVEDYVPGQREYAMHLLFARGRVQFAAQSTYDFDSEHHVNGHAMRPARARYDLVQDVPAIFSQTLAALDYSGTACIDYKRDPAGQIRIFEVNPRMGGSMITFTAEYLSAYAACLSAGFPDRTRRPA